MSTLAVIGTRRATNSACPIVITHNPRNLRISLNSKIVVLCSDNGLAYCLTPRAIYHQERDFITFLTEGNTLKPYLTVPYRWASLPPLPHCWYSLTRCIRPTITPPLHVYADDNHPSRQPSSAPVEYLEALDLIWKGES